jgi:hypothetical protein
LAHSLPSDVPGAAAIVRNGHIENWLRLRTKSGETANAIAHEAALTNGRKGASGSDDALIARVAMVLDPAAPIRYRRLCFLPDGLGPELALAWLENGDAQSPGEVLALNLPGQWLAAKPKSILDLAMLRKTYTRLNAFIDNRSLGYGFERCLYETNPGFPCQSPLIRNAHVISLEMLLPALEDAAATADIGSIPMDRHLAAFVAARWNEGVQPHLAALADPRPEGVIVGTIGIFAALQRRYDLPPLPRLSQWVGGRLNVVVETYHGRATRADLEHKLRSVCREGRFPELYNLVIDGNRRTSDVKGYTAAVEEFAAIRTQINALEADDPQTAARVREDDQRLAATLSVLASGFAAFAVVVSYLL